ncbi:UNVERIFIED_ORG: hypothetical protein J2X79_004268 [Arthrobacter globiformis]|nr:hypothetical protein [Arthrobacter globiformis]
MGIPPLRHDTSSERGGAYRERSRVPGWLPQRERERCPCRGHGLCSSCNSYAVSGQRYVAPRPSTSRADQRSGPANGGNITCEAGKHQTNPPAAAQSGRSQLARTPARHPHRRAAGHRRQTRRALPRSICTWLITVLSPGRCCQGLPGRPPDGPALSWPPPQFRRSFTGKTCAAGDEWASSILNPAGPRLGLRRPGPVRHQRPLRLSRGRDPGIRKVPPDRL